MAEELNTNTTPTVTDAPVNPVETLIETPTTPPITEPQPLTSPEPEPIAPTEPAPASPAPATPAPPPPAPPASEPEAPTLEPAKPAVPPAPVPKTSTIHRLLAKAREKIQFRKAKKLDKVLALARERGNIANDDVQKLLRVSDATATRYLVALVKSGKLKRAGHPRHARYEPFN